MRIIAGELKGRQLKTPKGMQTRPTSDKVKAAIFNVLGAKVVKARVLDLFAGTGNLALEALSRGAEKAVLVEKNQTAYETAKKNLELLKDKGKAVIYKLDAFTFLKQFSQEQFDLIFLDPPYHYGLIDRVISFLKNVSMLRADGVIIAETAVNEVLPEDLHPFEVRIIKEYGDTKVWFLQEIER